jgi:hypothetical protein
MPNQKSSTKGKGSQVSGGLVVLIIIVVVAIATAAFILIRQNQSKAEFTILGGDQSVLVLLHDNQDGSYNARYDGASPAQIDSLQVMLAGEILHVDVASVALQTDTQQVVLNNNNVQEGESFVLNPGDEFKVVVTYLGQTIGYNYMYGFRITSTNNDKTTTTDVIDPDYSSTNPDTNFLVNVK